jgi:hypothetical protein
MVKTQGKVSEVRLFQTPIQAQVEGKPVRILGCGDMEGASPVYLTVGEDGESNWESFDNVQINDTHFLPLSTETIQRSNTRNSAQTGSRR